MATARKRTEAEQALHDASMRLREASHKFVSSPGHEKLLRNAARTYAAAFERRATERWANDNALNKTEPPDAR